ncbi:M50 family metallopeptidase [Actinophytocola gossypii]|uniref:Site-2 protease family protein n=1 Tax=Actinophytocola gossypii TaxID=2812003 RepID=A0ABT2JBL9_9PSEU|nr:site-2 protease family protein [Actinophytocola gossypii]MCT2584694.1 site-2 protease family protein [Actinophytocola gossypii]
MVAWILGVILFALGICISVALHEAGHMGAAKMFGMRVRRYFIGFGPTLWSFRRGETEYGLKAIPAGGFCDIAGMTALDEVTPDEAPRAMWRYPTWKRFVVMVAGSVTHFILGFLILYVMAITMGLPNTEPVRPEIASVNQCVVDKGNTSEDGCAPGAPAPAKDAGLREGDLVLSVDGTPTPTWGEMVAKVEGLSGPAEFEVRRGGEVLTLTVDVARVSAPNGEQAGAIGVSVALPPAMIGYGPLDAVGGTVSFTGDMFVGVWNGLLDIPEKVPAVIEAIGGGERDPNTPVSVVGASIIGGDAVEQGIWEMFVLLLATLNFFIGVFNLLPLLPLDGGHIAVLFYEKVRDWLRRLRGKPAGGPVDYTKLSAVTMVFVVIGGAFMLLTLTADIVNPIRIGQ